MAVACGARLSCSVFMVYSVLLFMSLMASASIWRYAYSVHTIGGKPTYIESGARSHMVSQYSVNEQRGSVYI